MKAATVPVAYYNGNPYISIHAAREGGDPHSAIFNVCCCFISIHAAREGGDIILVTVTSKMYISIHAAREGGDVIIYAIKIQDIYFNPRRP